TRQRATEQACRAVRIALRLALRRLLSERRDALLAPRALLARYRSSDGRRTAGRGGDVRHGDERPAAHHRPSSGEGDQGGEGTGAGGIVGFSKVVGQLAQRQLGGE